MTIMKNLEKVHAAVVVDKAKAEGQLGESIGILAVEAIMKGIKSDEWKTYMSLFADNAEQLDRLTVETPGEGTYLRQARAYIVSNAVCAAGTNTFTGARVDERIDDGVNSEDPDGTVSKPPGIVIDL